MRKKVLLIALVVATFGLAFVLSTSRDRLVHIQKREASSGSRGELWSAEIEEHTGQGEKRYARTDQPDEFARLHREIRTRYGADRPEYLPNYKLLELERALMRRFGFGLSKYNPRVHLSAVLPWVERGPGNVSGRTRGLIVDPTDATGNTWFAGSVGGGIWKTTNAGQAWTNKTPNFPNLATTTLAISVSNPNVMYAGTGEGFFNVDAINGNGIFKSTDHGETWTQLTSTANTDNFENVNRIVVDPSNENIALTCTNAGFYSSPPFSGIFKSTDGGVLWTQVYSRSDGKRVQQIVANPQNSNTLYATVGGVGVIKSTDKGNTWASPSTGISGGARIEIAIAPTDTSRLYAAVENGNNSDLYFSSDGGSTWTFMQDLDGTNDNWLGGQGWYDNTIAVHPYAKDTVFVGGINIWKIALQPGGGTRALITAAATGTSSFLSFVNWGGPLFDGGGGTGSQFYGTTTTPQGLVESDYVSVEIRFGPGISQKAHRFLFGNSFLYPYQNYVSVPFQVWDITNNRQLMASFRDSENDGVFNLLTFNSANPQREYLFVNSVPYDTIPNPNIAATGGQRFKNIYAIWPILAANGTWNPSTLPSSKISINYQTVPTRFKTTTEMTNWFANRANPNHPSGFFPYVHADHHNLIMIPKNQTTNSFNILNANDGGMGISTDGGLNWTQNVSYNSTQFYGVDKKPGASEYIGGMQDNGTWRSAANPSATSPWINQLGGDGFEVSWHYKDPQRIIGSIQFNSIRKSTDGGATWSLATNGLSGSGSFITRVAKTNSDPDLLFTVSSLGVYRSDDFADNWILTPISTNWAFSSSFSEVIISGATPQVVWAGTRMDATGRIFVSRDGGVTFSATNNYTGATMGRISGLAAHPTIDSIAYALFSFARAPKVLRTTDYGQTWTDISGFGSGTASTNGFPDVATYCLQVMPFNTAVIWAGTEIGLFESTNGGTTWSYAANGLPAVSIWDMKIVDDQVVVATHGRGIWSVTLPELANYRPPVVPLSPRLNQIGQGPDGSLSIAFSMRSVYDSTVVYVNNNRFVNVASSSPKDTLVRYPVTAAGTLSVSVVSYVGRVPYKSPTKSANVIALQAARSSYSNNFNTSTTDFVGSAFSVATPAGFSNGAIHSTHPYTTNTNNSYSLLIPITVSSSLGLLKYEDIAIVEPGVPGSNFGSPNFYDYVVVEGTADGINWIALADGYDARFDAAWLSAYTGGRSGDASMFRSHTIDIRNKFGAGQKILLRFRLYSDPGSTGWGWAIDNLEIQTPATSVLSEDLLPKAFALAQNYPNPFNPSTVIKYELPKEGRVQLKVYDIGGRLVAVLVNGIQKAGRYEVKYQPSRLASGVYFYTLESESFRDTKKMMIVK